MEKIENLFRRRAVEKTPKKAPEKEMSENEEELPPNVKIVETEKTKFRIAHGKHNVEQKPEDLGKADALMLEGIFDYTLSKELVEKEFNGDLKEKIQYKEMIKTAEKKRAPIFVGDVIKQKCIFFSTLRLRDYLFAQKLKTIAERLETQKRKPEIAIVIGAGHTGIEEALKKSNEERVKLIDNRSDDPDLREAREKIATIARFDFNEKEGKWELTDRFKDPHLAKIEK